ncbi:MAG: DUF2059 domain-containing protein [Pseudomonadota bacterium]|nr:DUF2059 domain-containing protein [Pseudomonadota bacterium]
MKRILAAASAISLTCSAPVFAQDMAEEEVNLAESADVADSSGQDEALAEVMKMFGGLFQAKELTAEQEARLPASTQLVTTMMPEGFYAEMMGDMMDGMMGPMLSMMSGETGAMLVIGSRLTADQEKLDALSAEEKIELATILDPGFAERGAVMQDVIGEMMTQAATAIEPAFREGLSRAYAVRFSETQLSDIATFFETPTGSVFATENMKLMADPQVMSASMQALPAMMQQMGGMQAQMEEAMAALPAENAYEDLSEVQRARLSELSGIAPADLADSVSPPKPAGGFEDEDYAEEAAE